LAPNNEVKIQVNEYSDVRADSIETESIGDGFTKIKSWVKRNVIVDRKMFIGINHGNIKEKYKFLERLGAGSFGVVYKAMEIKTNRIVAIKVLYNKSEQGVSDFINEYRNLANLDHPNIGTLFEIFRWDSNLFLVTEYFEGGELAAFLEKNSHLSEY